MDLQALISFYVFLVSMVGVLVNCQDASRISRTMSSHLHRPQRVKISSCDDKGYKTFDICGVCGGDGSSCQGHRQGHHGSRSKSPRSRWSKFKWHQLWGPCSVSCGVGQRSRIAICFNIVTNHTASERRCSDQLKPHTEMSACVQPSCQDIDVQSDGASQDANTGDRLFNNHFGDLFGGQMPALPKFYMGEWTPCSVTCGEGSRSREVTCKLYNTFTRKEDNLPDSQCFGAKPNYMDTCNERACADDLPSFVNQVPPDSGSLLYKWHIGKFTECSRSCLGGVQESILRCVPVSDEQQHVSPALCSRMKKPPVEVRQCNTGPCPPRWSVGDYGSCSAECGGGVIRRSVRCVQNDMDDTVTEVDDFRCLDPAPVAQVSCNNVYCPALWASDSWEECSKTCGIGVQKRRVYCVKEPVTGRRVSVSEAECMGPRPSENRQCSDKDCPQDKAAPPVIRSENYTFIQLRRAKKVKLPVGGKIVLLPGQSITVRCPVKNFHRRLIFWSKRSKLLSMVGRIRATFNGNLKIRKANPVSDSGVYTCIAGPENADVTIEFLTHKDAQKKMKDVNHYLHNHQSQSAVILEPGEPSYRDGVVQDGGYNVTKKFVYMADDWSPCSVTCGSGHQKRRVTCTRVTNKYVKILPERECEKLGLEKPEEMRKCSPLDDCPHWVVGNWSKCSLETCVRDDYAERHRKLMCAYSNGTSAADDVCGEKTQETKRECVNRDCISHWTTSPWTPCRPSCGTAGQKIRMLTCSWRKTGLPAFTACQDKPRPVVSKVCKIRPCPSSKPSKCVDKSRYCSLVRMLKMCRYDDFRRKCCKACTTYLQSTLP